MKIFLAAASAVVIFASCQKQVSTKEQPLINAQTVADDALTPLPCHSTSMVTNYPLVAGEQPPFRFTKTLYSDSRVNTINMISRALPKHPAYKKQVWETIGQFTYQPHTAIFIGTKELWEYYKTPTGAGARKSILKKVINLHFYFDDRGHCYLVYNFINPQKVKTALQISYGDDNLNPDGQFWLAVREGSDEVQREVFPTNDKYGNPLFIYSDTKPGVSYTYDYSIPRGSKLYSYTPSQNLISFEYNMCEVMQWIPQPTYQRKTTTGVFCPTNDLTQRVTQSQVYQNQKFDTKGNMTSFTYADNVLQKTTWFCK